MSKKCFAGELAEFIQAELMVKKAVVNSTAETAKLNAIVSVLGKMATAGATTDPYAKLPNRRGTEGYTNHTGGAYGADSIWANMFRPHKVVNKHYRPMGDSGTVRVKALAKVDKVVTITAEEAQAGKELNEKLDNSTHDLNNRNFVQVYNADAVYAVAPIEQGKVTGGTGSAVRMAQELGREVYVLNTADAKWYTWSSGKYVLFTGVPPLRKNFAAIGTRGIESYNAPTGKGNFAYNKVLPNTGAIKSKMQEFVDVALGEVTAESTGKSTNQGSVNIYSGDINGFEGLSNFNAGPVMIEGIEFPTVEHAFQYLKASIASKPEDKNDNELKILQAKSGIEAQRAGRSISIDINKWDEKVATENLKYVMEEYYLHNEVAKNLLLSTGDKLLTHKGKNNKDLDKRFVKILTSIRESLRDSSSVEELDLSSNNRPSNYDEVVSFLNKVDTKKITSNKEGALDTMRPGIFGNPFTTSEAFAKVKDFYSYIGNNEEVSVAYYNWLAFDVIPENYKGNKETLAKARKGILDNLQQVISANKLYYNGTAAGRQINHVTALIAIANQYAVKNMTTVYETEGYKNFAKTFITAIKEAKQINIKMSISRAIEYINMSENGTPLDMKNPYRAIDVVDSDNNKIEYADFIGLANDEGALKNLGKKLNKDLESTRNLVKIYNVDVKSWLTSTKVHEHIHAGSAEFMRNNPKDPKTIYVNNLYKKLMKLSETDSALNSIQNGYWKENIDEFIAVSLSNVDMFNYLRAMEVNNQSVMSKLVSTLLDMIGIKTNNEFAELLNTFNGMLNNETVTKPSSPEITAQINDPEVKNAKVPEVVAEPVETGNGVRESEEADSQIGTESTVESTGYEIAPGVMATKGQAIAIESISEWFGREGINNSTFLLAGRGGTGKTSVVAAVLKALGLKGSKVFFATPSNSATKVLFKSVSSKGFSNKDMFSTTTAIASRRPKRDSNNRPVVDADGNQVWGATGEITATVEAAGNADLIVIDESSMMSSADLKEISDLYTGKKILFIGDVVQLPPVNDKDENGNVLKESAVFTRNTKEGIDYAELTEVKRQKEGSTIGKINDLVYAAGRELVSHVRSGKKAANSTVDDGDDILKVVGNTVEIRWKVVERLIQEMVKDKGNTDTSIVNSLTDASVITSIAKSMVEKGVDARVVMYNAERHSVHQNLSKAIRKEYLKQLGIDEEPKGLVPGDLIMMKEKYNGYSVGSSALKIKNDTIMLYENTEENPMNVITKNELGKVTDVSEPKIMEYIITYKGEPKRVRTEFPMQIVTVQIGDTKVQFPQRAAFRVGAEYTRIKGVPNMSYGYVGNAHKVQGVTSHTVYVDYANIRGMLANSEIDPGDILKALYVAISRPTDKLVIRMQGLNIQPESVNSVTNNISC